MIHDVAIVGAGPVGGVLALALAGADLDVVALDARDPGTIARSDRSLALSHGARLIFERIGVWPRLAVVPDAVTPITTIDISQAHGFGVTRLSATEQGVPALGYVVSYNALQHAIDAALAQTGVQVRFGARVAGVGGTPAYAAVSFAGDGEDPTLARLAVVADGTGTIVRGIARERRDYGQVALIAKVWMKRPHDGVAFERFTADGPMALLPEGDHYGLVWTLAPAAADAALALPDDAFVASVGHHFGARMRGFERVAQRKVFPLSLDIARPSVAARCVLVGNAAQALHPIAGQGINLGLRDSFELARAILAADRDALGDRTMVSAYAARRRTDRAAGIAFTHGLARMFANPLPLVSWPRGLALALLDAVPPAKKAFTRAMLFGMS
jgi:2-octaprenyl-6-methoxyphenol hydroxylase